MKRRYNALCRHYSSPSILEEPGSVADLGRQMWNCRMIPEYLSSGPEEKPIVVYVGTDWEQDRSGIVQALESLCRLTLFEGSPGIPGQIRAATPSEVKTVRKRNGELLHELVDSLCHQGPVQMVIGQMWGRTMDWRVLATFRDRGIAVVNISMDDRHAFTGPKLQDGTDSGVCGLLPYLSLACTDAPECVSWYEAEGCKAIYFPEASDPDIFSPMDVSKSIDVCFVGANYGIRNRMIEALVKEGVKVTAHGYGWSNGRIPTEQEPALFARSKLILGCGTIGHCSDFFALKLRDFDGPMSGTLYLTHDNPDLRPLFRIGEEIVTFQTIPEMVEKVRFLLVHDEARESIAQAGRSRALAEHTWNQRFRCLFNSLESHQ